MGIDIAWSTRSFLSKSIPTFRVSFTGRTTTMKQMTRGRSESLPPTSTLSVEYIGPSTTPAGAPRTDRSAEIYRFSAPLKTEEIPTGLRRVSERLPDLERNPRRAAFLAQARQDLAKELAESGETIRTLRLGRGFSQTKLAELIGTQQPHIARIESGQEINISTARKLAAALGVDMNKLDAALQCQEQT